MELGGTHFAWNANWYCMGVVWVVCVVVCGRSVDSAYVSYGASACPCKVLCRMCTGSLDFE